LVTRVIDGDTIEVSINGDIYTVRYIGIDTPEEGQPFNHEASYNNENLVNDKTVTLIKDVSETDRYDRLLRYVIVGDTFVNYRLVEKGYALPAIYPPDVACQSNFAQAEQTARGYKLGLWAPEPTTPPRSAPIVPPASSSGGSRSGGSGSSSGGGGSSSGGSSTSSGSSNRAGCDQNYPTVCIPPYPPDLDCGNIPYRNFSVPGYDPHGFDRDNDGIGCET
jgi:micrococcal nuclease